MDKNLNEAILDNIFGKDKLSDTQKIDKKLAKELPDYNPVNPKAPLNQTGIFTTDSDEIKKRLTGALGVVIGNNTVKSMANKAIKTFPIIVSDDISPETTVMFKSYMEEQYCNDLSLLISNMTIDLSKFKKNSSDGNIAIQALNVVSNNDFSKQSLARKALNGNLSTDDVFKNSISYTLLRTESFDTSKYTTGNDVVDNLLSEAAVMPSSAVNDYIGTVTALYEHVLNEAVTIPQSLETKVRNDQIELSLASYLRCILDKKGIDIEKTCGLNIDFKHMHYNITDSEYEVICKLIQNTYNISDTRYKGCIKKVANSTDSEKDEQFKLLLKCARDDNFDPTTTPQPGPGTVGRTNEPRGTNGGGNGNPRSNFDGNEIDNTVAHGKYLQYEKDYNTFRSAVAAGLDHETAKIADKYFNQTLAPLRYGKVNNGISVNWKDHGENTELRTMADVLALPENEIIRDRFNKALYLLSTNRIAGHEFISYSIDRLGIPIGPNVRNNIISTYPTENVVLKGSGGYSLGTSDVFSSGNNGRIKNLSNRKGTMPLSADEREAAMNAIDNGYDISINPKIYEIAHKITGEDWKKALKYMGIGAAVGAGAGATGAGIAVAAGVTVACPWILPVIAGGAAISGLGTLVGALVHAKHKKGKVLANTYVGWERVEALINDLDRNYLNVRKMYTDVYRQRNDYITDYAKSQNSGDRNYSTSYELHSEKKTEVNLFKEFTNKMGRVYDADITCGPLREEFKKQTDGQTLTEAVESTSVHDCINIDRYEDLCECICDMTRDSRVAYVPDLDTLKMKAEIFEECLVNVPYLAESFISKITGKSKKPTTIVVSNKLPVSYETVEIKNKNKQVEPLIVPEFEAQHMLAYGSVEYDRKTIKDRRYNEPLFLTVKFKSRYADDKYSDNELTAVIGVQGIITRVPSEEMVLILKDNAGVDTDRDAANIIADNDKQSSLLTILNQLGSGNKLDLDKSGPIWNNLTKSTQLALANKLAGKSGNTVANAHLIFSESEINKVKIDSNIDYTKNIKLAEKLIKKYNASELIIANDLTETAHICDDIEKISFDVVPYSALRSKSSSDQTTAILNQISRNRI